MKKCVLLFLLIASFIPVLPGQPDPFQLYLEPVQIQGLPGIQSFAFAQSNGLWLLIGGRRDGLHPREPFRSFSAAERNTQLIVVNPGSGEVWTSSLSSLPLHLQDQLSSTNMQFLQDGNTLILTGGYGYSATIDEKLTFAMLTLVDVKGLITAIINQDAITPFFKSTTDPRFAVTGGQLEKIHDTYYLIGGHAFDGDYNPMDLPTFTQAYTNACRKFKIDTAAEEIEITYFSSMLDTAVFHRRDFNVVPQILQDGQQGLMAFSGVFQTDVDIPFVSATRIDSGGYHTVPGFAQYYNHYHCAQMPLYAAGENEMHTIFFGGIAQYYDIRGVLVQDSDVPFTQSISRVTRAADGSLKEYLLPVHMPAYLGAAAEFILRPDVPHLQNGIILWDHCTTDTTMVGYILGGIESSAANIFWINDGNQSRAHPTLYRVFLIRDAAKNQHALNAQSCNGLQLQIHTDTEKKELTLVFSLDTLQPVDIVITNAKGKTILKEDLSEIIVPGRNIIRRQIRRMKMGQIYIVHFRTPAISATQMLIIKG